ncbi:tRNA (5-methylaminomethyl-2-thiouridylate)-methyltransferase [Isoptericola sp. CG 20/1183]|uniref:tRNA-specific 2-thiouridylase MnmA n=1 Tax=Isoptericola halotolerans TaxID=300560 RepID=A0ABX5EB90_9MICO|nr:MULTISPECIES: tRNA 2-thiouridine(34) synthase MnmA [Isoptericola]PRZ04782.1 tRNA (5-methylaminomethyl-2-thiouridylate)-methyltransferase [Isoptericola halotolerans]PRZ05273.1 tRNA (5-methylaminomethyl-2-thiouridylate)-methyltransferase [Isoptericola sp. CG 20/1183]
MRVLAAMSGGVDSAVAAALAVEAGHDVVGVHMALSRNRDQFRTGSRGCCSIEDAGDARRAADVLGIPYYVWDLSETFEETVVADFLSEYSAGRTPNPCVRCNEHIKFEALLDKATALGFDAVATGHYARVEAQEAPDGTVTRELHRSPNDAKDQSYVLAVMGPERLDRAMFPLGGFASKDEVRAEAERRGLSVSAKPDSYDICFVADGDTRGFLRSRLGAQPGEVRDTDGNVVGEHQGAYAYTVGQRKGLGLGRPAPDGRARYVVDVDTGSNTVVVGPAELLSVDRIAGDRAVWFAPAATDWTDCEVQVRAHGRAVPAQVRAVPGADGGADGLELRLGEELRGIAAGQSVVAYRGTRVLGQATVSRAWRDAPVTTGVPGGTVPA